MSIRSVATAVSTTSSSASPEIVEMERLST